MTEKRATLQNMKNLFLYLKMSKEIFTFSNIEIEKNKFCHHKTPTFLGDVDTEKVLVSNKISFDEKTISTLLVTCIM